MQTDRTGRCWNTERRAQNLEACTQSDSEAQSFGGRGRIVASANRATVAYLPQVASAKFEARSAKHEEEAPV